jgi:integrase/recombinase XerD
MSGGVAALVADYVALRRHLGYRSPSQERALRAFARYLDQAGHEGPIPLEASLDWATSTGSLDPCNPARRLTAVRGFLVHMSAVDCATEVPPPGLLGPVGHRKPPHVYSDREISDLLQAATSLAPTGGLRPHCYATLFGLIACTGLRISEALMLTCGDVDLVGGVLTVRAGKRGRTRLVPLHPSALAPLRDYAADRSRRFGWLGEGDAFFRTDRSGRVSYNAANSTFIALRRSTAMHLLQSGTDLAGIALWLGHESPATTHQYLEADLAAKQAVLRRLADPGPAPARFQPDDRLLAFLQDL